MTIVTDSTTVSLLSLALDATAMRQQAIAQNIANVNTPGYQRVGVSFESRVEALRQRLGDGAAPALANLAPYRPQLESSDSPVSLDMEMASLSENTLHHQVLLKLLNKHYALLGSAINEGKK
ncbi:flagellar basal body rod protein FlgB [Duganella sp. FT80W]|uniref:Flagellar basal body rod protein FlgB n=1 Tax=Duganella guangzhouensis TaxID=2666084 RepID=A0A6I2L7N9_9BURK|nr:flagellar basal body rod protein FlgB [Duganella guangzhouensis]MRW94168.1 flagellar basal body rod protein FlgB [Duganella guangzhouensis]